MVLFTLTGIVLTGVTAKVIFALINGVAIGASTATLGFSIYIIKKDEKGRQMKVPLPSKGIDDIFRGDTFYEPALKSVM